MNCLIALLFCLSLNAGTYTIGDSHVGSCYIGTPVYVSGSTFRELKAGLEGKKSRFTPAKLGRIVNPDTILLAFGTNDAGMLRYYKRSEFISGVNWVIHNLRSKYPTAKIVLVGPPGSHRSLRVNEIDGILSILAKEEGIRYIERISITPYDQLRSDGVHFTLRGYGETHLFPITVLIGWWSLDSFYWDVA